MINPTSLEEQKTIVKQLLMATDYAVLSDVAIDNQDEFENYRDELRNILKSDRLLAIPTNTPDPVWSDTSIQATAE